jgi:UDP-N-acetylenolpyruvoylglucosamine reductase
VINLSGGLGLWELDLDGAVAGGGANMAQLCRAASRTGLTGAKDLITTGSSVGGAVHAAANGQIRFAKPLDWVEVARPGRTIERIQLPEKRGQRTGIDLDLHRRVVARARFQLVDDRTEPEPEKGEFLARNRVQRQLRSAEPLFVDSIAGRAESLLTDAGCLDLKIGGARLSSQQANRVCTSKTARATDVLELARLVREHVLRKEDVALEPAICFVDEDGRKVDL